MEQNSNSFVRGKFSGTTLTCTLVQGVARHFSAARPPRGCRGDVLSWLSRCSLSACVQVPLLVLLLTSDRIASRLTQFRLGMELEMTR